MPCNSTCLLSSSVDFSSHFFGIYFILYLDEGNKFRESSHVGMVPFGRCM